MIFVYPVVGQEERKAGVTQMVPAAGQEHEETKTLVFVGRVTVAPAAGTVPEDQVAGSCQFFKSASFQGQAVLELR